MQEKFFEYYKYNDAKLEEIVKDSIIVFDTNVLLDIYRYSNESREKFFEIISTIKDRLWLPYQVGVEFFRNRPIVIYEKAHSLEQLKKDMTKNLDSIINDIENPNNKQYKLIKFEKELQNKITVQVGQAKQNIIKMIDECENISDDAMSPSNDLILSKISEIFQGRVNNQLPDKDLGNIFEEGRKRYKDKVPPGYEDAEKPEPQRYGDLVVWNEIMKYSEEQKKDILLITSDKKGDWWHIVGNKTIGPRPELLKEFNEKTKQFAYLYTTDYFIHYISDTYKIENTKQLEKDTIEILGNRNSFNKKYLCERHKNEYLDRHLINSRLSNKYLNGSNELSQKYLQPTSERIEKYKKLIMDRALHKSEKVEDLIAWFFNNYENPEGLVPYDSETGKYIYVSGGPYDPFEELSENFPDLDGLTVVKAAQAVLKTGVEWVRVGEY